MSVAFLADENFNGRIVRGFLRRLPSANIVCVQDVGLVGKKDPIVLEWAAQNHRVLLSHDVSTIAGFAYSRVAVSLPMPGVFELKSSFPIGLAIEDLVLISECSEPDEWDGLVTRLPL
ncbi:MAG TPA: DUF5615 family PIN-like protein [Tepidisphaeraceae bacterium]|nr:DUF5615 family PIN-like protein [Tepidisphaeraceae bacterium]